MSVLREVSALSSVNTFSECTAPKGSADQLGAADSTGFLLLYTACLIVLFSLLIYAPFQIVSNMFIVVLYCHNYNIAIDSYYCFTFDIMFCREFREHSPLFRIPKIIQRVSSVSIKSSGDKA